MAASVSFFVSDDKGVGATPMEYDFGDVSIMWRAPFSVPPRSKRSRPTV
jgi:hypothetical protein